MPAYLRAFRTIFLVCASLAGLAFVLALVLMPQVELGKDDEELKMEGREREKKREKLSMARRSSGEVKKNDEERVDG